MNLRFLNKLPLWLRYATIFAGIYTILAIIGPLSLYGARIPVLGMIFLILYLMSSILIVIPLFILKAFSASYAMNLVECAYFFCSPKTEAFFIVIPVMFFVGMIIGLIVSMIKSLKK